MVDEVCGAAIRTRPRAPRRERAVRRRRHRSFIPAKVPQYTLRDFSGDYWVLPQVRQLGGVSDSGDRKYDNRIFSNGIEPGLGRTFYTGFSYEF